MLKRKCTIALLILSLTLAFLTGCAEKEELDDNIPLGEPALDLRSYFPTAEGAIYTFAGEGNEYAAFTREVKFIAGSRAQIHDNNGGTIVASVYEVSKEQVSLLYREPEFYENISIIAKAGSTPKDIILKAPLKAGNAWESTEWRREIVAMDQNLTVPAGTFYHVIKIKLTSKQSSTETYEYYAQNVGLIVRETIIEENKISSRLFSYGVKEAKATEESKTGKTGAAVGLGKPDLTLLAYQLDHQLRSTFQSSYESYINLGKLTQYNQKNFDQIIDSYREQIEGLAVKEIVDEQIERLKQLYSAGEGEVTFPAYEVVKAAKLVNATPSSARVFVTLTKYFPAREWRGSAYDRTSDYTIDLVKDKGGWKLKKVDVAE